MNNQTTLITGASSGIGQALAFVYAKNGANLILTGREESALIATAKKCEKLYDIRATWISQDLTQTNAARNIYDFCKNKGVIVTTLINNAGLGEYGNFHNMSQDNIRTMLSVNIHALVDLTYLFLQDMVLQKNGSIVNIGSVYSYVAVPNQVLYAATKAFVKSFSLGLSSELQRSGVEVSCVCPGATHTQFHQRAGIEKKDDRFSLSAEIVAEKIYDGLTKKKWMIIPGWYNKLFVILVRHLPEAVLPAIVKFLAYRLRAVRSM